jgi:hypothetical protein
LQGLSGSAVWAICQERGRKAGIQPPTGRDKQGPAVGEEPAAAHMWFFEDIRRINQVEFQRALHTVDQAFEIDAIGTSVFILCMQRQQKA